MTESKKSTKAKNQSNAEVQTPAHLANLNELHELLQKIHLMILQSRYGQTRDKNLVKKNHSLLLENLELLRQAGAQFIQSEPYNTLINNTYLKEVIRSTNDEFMSQIDFFQRIIETLIQFQMNYLNQEKLAFLDLVAVNEKYLIKDTDQGSAVQEKIINHLAQESPPKVVTSVIMEISLGSSLATFFDTREKSILNEKISKVTEYISAKTGIHIPPAPLTPGPALAPNEYAIYLDKKEISRFEIFPDKLLALNILKKPIDFPAMSTTDPSFGIPAFWIQPSLKKELEKNFRIIDAGTVLANHLQRAINENITELVTFEVTSGLIEEARNNYPSLVKELMEAFSIKNMQLIFKSLLEENVSIRDLRTIFECLQEKSKKTRNTSVLCDEVRIALAPQIIRDIDPPGGVLPAVVFSKELENEFLDYSEKKKKLKNKKDLIQRIDLGLLNAVEGGPSTVLLVPGSIRRFVKKFLKGYLDHLYVLAESEIPSSVKVRYLARVE
jgi:flagellar biosynthesis protein FlhA